MGETDACPHGKGVKVSDLRIKAAGKRSQIFGQFMMQCLREQGLPEFDIIRAMVVKCQPFKLISRDRRRKKKTLKLSLIHISEPTRRTPISYAVFCLKKKKN